MQRDIYAPGNSSGDKSVQQGIVFTVDDTPLTILHPHAADDFVALKGRRLEMQIAKRYLSPCLQSVAVKDTQPRACIAAGLTDQRGGPVMCMRQADHACTTLIHLYGVRRSL